MKSWVSPTARRLKQAQPALFCVAKLHNDPLPFGYIEIGPSDPARMGIAPADASFPPEPRSQACKPVNAIGRSRRRLSALLQSSFLTAGER